MSESEGNSRRGCCLAGPANGFRKNFREQKLPAWQPLYSSGYIALSFLVIGLISVALGGVLTGLNTTVREYQEDYTECNDCHINVSPNSSCECNVTFNLPDDISGRVYIQYRLTNYYQNHRRYVTSRDDSQLRGHLENSPSDDCEPYKEAMVNGEMKKIVPCGAIANSIFNDTFNLIYQELDVPITRKGIAWATDAGTKFQNPSGGWSAYKTQYTMPPSWSEPIWDMEGGMQNEPFIVWMRTASVPDFRKPYGIVERSGEFDGGLKAGIYHMQINYNYPVDEFSGRKYFVITNASIIGAENSFIGIAYLIVGGVSLIVALIFALLKMKGPNSASNRYPTTVDAPQ